MELPPLQTKAAAKVYEDYIGHNSGQVISSETAIVTILRGRYPDYHVTVTSHNIIAYSKSEHARAELDTQTEDFSAWRVYAPPNGRHSKEPGMMQDKVHFGRWPFRWTTEDFIVYKATFPQGFSTVTNYYVLHKRDQEMTDGRCKITDDLIAAAAEWTLNVHEEVFVFDQERWTKNSELYSSVQDASWDDVIMSKDMKEALVNDVEGFFDCKEDYKEFAVPWKRGIVFYGLVSRLNSLPMQNSLTLTRTH